MATGQSRTLDDQEKMIVKALIRDPAAQRQTKSVSSQACRRRLLRRKRKKLEEDGLLALLTARLDMQETGTSTFGARTSLRHQIPYRDHRQTNRGRD